MAVSTVSSMPQGRLTGESTRAFRVFYLATSLWAAAIAIVGFWPTYFGPLLTGTLDLRPILKLHGLVFSGWFALLISQAGLAFSRRLDLHRRLGRLAVAYTVALILLGLAVTVDEFSIRIAAGEIRSAHRFLLVPLGDIALFASFFGAAIAYRQRPEFHKRLIVVATTVLLGPAVGRMVFLAGSVFPPPAPRIALVFAVLLSPVWLGMAFDIATRRRVHRVYVIGVAVIVLSGARVALRDSDAWINFSKWMVGLIT